MLVPHQVWRIIMYPFAYLIYDYLRVTKNFNIFHIHTNGFLQAL